MKEIDYFHLGIPIFVPLYKDNVAYSYTELVEKSC